MKLNKKAQFGLDAMVPTIITFVIIAVVAVLGLQLLGDQQADLTSVACATNSTGGTDGTILYTSCGADYNSTTDAISGVAKFPEKLPMIAGVLVLVLIISILIAAFNFRR